MQFTCLQLIVATQEKKCYANPYFARASWPAHPVNRLRGGVGEQETFSASSEFLSSLPRSAKHPAVVFAVLDGTCVSERIVSNEAYTRFVFFVPSTAYPSRAK